MLRYKLGKLAAEQRSTDLELAHYVRAGALPTPPRAFGFDGVESPANFLMLGNDEVGDCTCAGAAHEIMVQSGARVTGQVRPAIVAFTTKGVLSDYSAITGYVPGDPNTDNGAVIQDVLDYRKATGMVDASGNRHKIDAYARVDHTNLTEVATALYVFEALTIGVNLPESAQEQFPGKWTVVPGSPIEGGHDVELVYWSPTEVGFISWGQLVFASMAWFKKYVTECWLTVSADMLTQSGKSARGYDLAALMADAPSL